MSVTINKPISEAKELFLSIALLAGEVYSYTIRMMKADYGSDYIKSSVIHPLKESGYICRVGRKSSYGYVLTPAGMEYLRVKFPDKYDYDGYKNSRSFKYDKKIRYRNAMTSYLLYTLFSDGIDLSDNRSIVADLFHGKEVEIERPFFISIKVIRRLFARLRGDYGSRIYGWIFTREAVFAVYSPDREHPLFTSREEPLNECVKMILRSSQAPFNSGASYKYIFIFPAESVFLDSFQNARKDTLQKSTANFYRAIRFNEAFCYFPNRSGFSLQDLINKDFSIQIDSAFIDYYNLTYAGINGSFINFPFQYDEKYRTAICWKLNPVVIIDALDILDSGYEPEYLVMLCLEDDVQLIVELLSKLRINNRVLTAGLPPQDINRLLSSEIHYSE